jgi:ABC-type histidine transport system ATPase subunit
MSPHALLILAVVGGLLALPLLAALTYATAVAGKSVSGWLNAKGETSVVAKEAAIIWDTALAVVSDIEANEKSILEARGTGPLTALDYKQLKDTAMTRAKAVLKERGIDTLKAMFDALLSGKIEQAVAVVSAGRPAVAAATATLTVAPAASPS